MSKLSVAKPAPKDKPKRSPHSYARPYKHLGSSKDPWRTSLRHQVSGIRSIAQLLDNISENRYECQGAWEEFGTQVETLSMDLVDRLVSFEEWLDRSEEPSKAKAAAAVGGAR